MRRSSRIGLVALLLISLPLCMGASCSSRDIRDAVYGGALNYVKNSATGTLNEFVPIQSIFANLFAGPTGEQDQ